VRNTPAKDTRETLSLNARPGHGWRLASPTMDMARSIFGRDHEGYVGREEHTVGAN